MKDEDMTWDYRICEKLGVFGIFEVYYRNADSEEIVAVTVDPVHPLGETLEEIMDDLAAMAQAVKKKPLVWETVAENCEPYVWDEEA